MRLSNWNSHLFNKLHRQYTLLRQWTLRRNTWKLFDDDKQINVFVYICWCISGYAKFPLWFPGFTVSPNRIFTEPTDCSHSHFCSEVGAQSTVSKCPNGQIFDSKSKLCVQRLFNYQRICHKISCDGVTNDFVIFPSNPAFYAYCFTSATGVEHTYMYKCDDEINKVFDIETKKCRFNCESIGYYADPFDCSSYYICNGLKFASRRVHCPPNYFFNGTVCLNSKAHCPTGSLVANVITSSPTVNNSMAADEISATSHSMTEEPSSTTTLLLSESTIMETSTTHDFTTHSPMTEGAITDDPMTHDSIAHEPMSHENMSHDPMTHDQTTIMETVDLPIDMTTKKPSGTIWKHMGLFSVRVGRLLNIIWETT